MYGADIAVIIVTRLHAGRLGFDSRLGKKRFFSIRCNVQSGSGSFPPSPTQWTPGSLSPGGVKLITHLHLALRLRMCDILPPLPHTSSWRVA